MAVICGGNVAHTNDAVIEFSDLGLELRTLLAPLLGIEPDAITPADVEMYRAKHIYQGKMNLDLRSTYGGFITHGKRFLTEHEIEKLHKDSDEFIASLER
jgi:hypothetical protein